MIRVILRFVEGRELSVECEPSSPWSDFCSRVRRVYTSPGAPSGGAPQSPGAPDSNHGGGGASQGDGQDFDDDGGGDPLIIGQTRLRLIHNGREIRYAQDPSLTLDSLGITDGTIITIIIFF